MRTRIIATPCQGKDLQPGELFSTAGTEYWDLFESFDSVGERCYIRTNCPTAPEHDPEETIYRLSVIREVSPDCRRTD